MNIVCQCQMHQKRFHRRYVHNIPKENTKVICRRCKAMLGEKVSSDTIKCYTTEIMIQPSNECYYMISRMKYLESILVRLLMEYSTCRSTFRFCIQMASAFFCFGF
ncbi:hypothetical protein XELAEV_18027325mg [Xenopus laevis]|uniref:E3 ubiquitin-protein ligase E3D n=1 Tax=Xenopus laevis TaxID=8355 RepID=A0A974CVB6_XENLA|nr:hypothetical protein XELAEV_18027325mg [Xenopus laevis]